MQQATCELLLLWLNIFEQFEWTEQYWFISCLFNRAIISSNYNSVESLDYLWMLNWRYNGRKWLCIIGSVNLAFAWKEWQKPLKTRLGYLMLLPKLETSAFPINVASVITSASLLWNSHITTRMDVFLKLSFICISDTCVLNWVSVMCCCIVQLDVQVCLCVDQAHWYRVLYLTRELQSA
jgi:hypothetical protein